MRYFITLSYDGAGFCGWQYQPNAVTVQECLEQTLSTLLKEPVQVVGAGRTDSKVNAIGYVAHFDYDKVIDTTRFGYKLNAILPRGIVVHSVHPADGDLHARFSATRREYTYFLHRTKDPFIEARSYFCPWALDVEAMNEAAALLLGTHDFRCFEKSGSDNRTSVCTVTEAFWAPYVPDHVSLLGFSPAASPDTPPVIPSGAKESTACSATQFASDTPPATACEPSPAEPLYLYFRIAADRFLRNMVRAVVGSLIEVGRGRRSVADFAALILPADSYISTSQSTPLPATSRDRSTLITPIAGACQGARVDASLGDGRDLGRDERRDDGRDERRDDGQDERRDDGRDERRDDGRDERRDDGRDERRDDGRDERRDDGQDERRDDGRDNGRDERRDDGRDERRDDGQDERRDDGRDERRDDGRDNGQDAGQNAGPGTGTPERQRTAPDSPERIRTSPDGTPFRSLAGESVPGHALFLSRVDY